MADPMDTPPVDHGSDRYDYIEVDSPSGDLPSGLWWEEAQAEACPDCRANLFVKWTPLARSTDPADARNWTMTTAHDPSCPWLAKHEQGR